MLFVWPPVEISTGRGERRRQAAGAADRRASASSRSWCRAASSIPTTGAPPTSWSASGYQAGERPDPGGHRAAHGADAAARRLHPEGAAVPPPRHGLSLRAGRRCSPPRPRTARATSSSYDLDDDGRARRRSTDRPGRNTAGVIVGVVTTRHRGPPRGDDAGSAMLRRPDEVDGLDRRGRVPPSAGRHRPGRGASTSRSSGSPLSGRRPHRHGQREREPRLGRRGAAPDRRVHPGPTAGAEPGDQRRGGGRQRRRPAVLERRGDDADAHPGHPRDDAGLARWC